MIQYLLNKNELDSLLPIAHSSNTPTANQTKGVVGGTKILLLIASIIYNRVFFFKKKLLFNYNYTQQYCRYWGGQV